MEDFEKNKEGPLDDFYNDDTNAKYHKTLRFPKSPELPKLKGPPPSSIKFRPKIILVGPQGAGKTNYLMALLYRLQERGTGLLEASMEGPRVTMTITNLETGEENNIVSMNDESFPYTDFKRWMVKRTKTAFHYRIQMNFGDPEVSALNKYIEFNFLDFPGEGVHHSDLKEIRENSIGEANAIIFMAPIELFAGEIIDTEHEKVDMLDASRIWINEICEIRGKLKDPKIPVCFVFSRADKPGYANQWERENNYVDLKYLNGALLAAKWKEVMKNSRESLKFCKGHRKELYKILINFASITPVESLRIFYVSSWGKTYERHKEVIDTRLKKVARMELKTGSNVKHKENIPIPEPEDVEIPFLYLLSHFGMIYR